MDNSLEQKQTYLRKEILEAGLDGGEFMAFLITTDQKKGQDLDNWDGKQLTKVVSAFKNSKGVKPSSPQKVQKSPVLRESLPEIQSPTKKLSLLQDHLYKQQINCDHRVVNSICKEENLVIKVSKYDKIQGGVFERAYVRFTIQIPTMSVVVYRRYNEFAWLRDTLILLYPGFPVPPIAKKGKRSHFQDKPLRKRMYILQKFLNALVKMPELCSDIVVEKFLTSTDPKQFQKFRSQYNKLDNNLPVKKLKTSTGTVTVSTEKTMTLRVARFNQFLKETQPDMKKIYKNFKGVATSFQSAAEYLKAIGGNCNILMKRQNDLRSQFQMPLIEEKSIFYPLEKLTHSYAQNLLSHARSFRKQVYSLAKYESFYKLNMLESIDQLKLKQQEYNQVKSVLLKKKQKLYADGKMSKWGLKNKDIPKPQSKQQAFAIMLPKDTNQVIHLREMYALQNAQIYDECYRHTKQFHRDISGPMRQFLEMQLTISNQTTQGFFDVISKIKEVQSYHNVQ